MSGDHAIRDAVDGDVPAIVDLVNVTIASGTAAWTTEPETIDDRRQWLAAADGDGWAALVAEDGMGIIGFASYGPFRDNLRWPGYRFTVENSIHVAARAQRSGVGTALMAALIDRARAQGLHAMVAAVDSATEHSIAFHASLGFVEVGRLPEIGRKHDRWLDLVLMQRLL